MLIERIMIPADMTTRNTPVFHVGVEDEKQNKEREGNQGQNENDVDHQIYFDFFTNPATLVSLNSSSR